MDENKEARQYGAWIPPEIMIDNRLSPVDKLLYAEIACFGSEGCYKKSEVLMERLGIKTYVFRKSCEKLEGFGYIKQCKQNNGRVMRKTTLGFAKSKNCTEPKCNNCTMPKCKNCTVKNTDKNTDKSLISKDIKGAEAPEIFGNIDINDLYDKWEEIVGFRVQSKQSLNRQAANTLIKRHTKEKVIGVMYAVRASLGEKYAPKISNFMDLRDRWNDLAIWCQRTKNTQEDEKPRVLDLTNVY
jgi:hypothetical protein